MKELFISLKLHGSMKEFLGGLWLLLVVTLGVTDRRNGGWVSKRKDEVIEY